MNSLGNRFEVIVIGGGISGLATAWYLKKAGISFKLIEKEPQAGGVITSVQHPHAVLDFGPNSLRDRTGKIRKLADELGLGDEIIEVSEAFKIRYIVRDGQLQKLSPSISSMITTNILSAKAKLRLLKEPFAAKGSGQDESIGSFLERRIGKEAVEYLADPFFSGIYAGDIYKMSKQAVLPKLAELEDRYGSLLWGAIRSKRDKKEDSPKQMVLTFNKGIQQLSDSLYKKLNDQVIHAEVTKVEKSGNGYKLTTPDADYHADKVISCIPAYAISRLIEDFKPELSDVLSDIEYSPMLSTQVLFNSEEINFSEEGFGFLVPRKENIRLLGAIWKSSIFPQQSNEGVTHFALMTGGAHDCRVRSEDVENIQSEVIAEFSQLMGIEAEPAFVESKLWHNAIPQFKVGYTKTLSRLEEAEKENPGLHLCGNYRWGVSVPDCIAGAENFVKDLN